MTFNIHHGKGIDKQRDLSRIAEVIEKSDVDIIGLNEVDKHFSKRSLFEDQTMWLAEQLNTEYFFSPSLSINLKTQLRYVNMEMLFCHDIQSLQKRTIHLIIYPD